MQFRQFVRTSLQLLFWTILGLLTTCWGQTASTGALLGQVLDPTGRGVPQASIEARNQDSAVGRSTSSDEEGHFVLPLLPPGTYQVTVTKTGYSQMEPLLVRVPVTESIRVSLPMKLAGVTQSIEVKSDTSPLQGDTVALGRVVDAPVIQALPLAARNFTQIVGLSPGVLTGVNNAGELGLGGSGLAQIDAGNDGIFVHGSRSYDNSYEFDAVPVTDLQASSIARGGSHPQPRCNSGIQGSNWSLQCIVRRTCRGERHARHQIGHRCSSRKHFRILPEQCPERQRFLSQPRRPTAS